MKKLILLFLILSPHAYSQSDEELLGIDSVNLNIEDYDNSGVNFDDSKYIEAESSTLDIDAEDEEKFTVADPDLFDQSFPEIDFSTVDEIKKKDPEMDILVDKMARRKSDRNFTFAEKEALKIKLKDIISSGTFHGGLRRGTKLVHIQTGKSFYLQKDITVLAYRKSDYENCKLLINKNGFTTYKVQSQNITSIAEVTNLYEEPHQFKPVVHKKVDIKFTDSEFKFNNNYRMHVGFTSPVFINDLGGSEARYGQTNRFEFTSFGQFNFPLQVGLTASYENHFGKFSNNGNYVMRTMAFGPSFKSEAFTLGDTNYHFIGQVKLALTSSITLFYPAETVSYKMSQTSMALGLEREVDTFIGKIQLGGYFQRQWVRVSSQRTQADVSSNNNFNDSFTLAVGFNTDHIW